MGCILFLAIGAALWVAGDQISSYLLPTVAPELGRWLLIIGIGLIGTLLWSPTRFIAEAIFMGVVTTVVIVLRVLARAFISILRIAWSSGRTAAHRLRGERA